MAVLFGAMAVTAATLHQRSMAYEFASTAILMLLGGVLMFLIRQSDRPGWRGAKIKFDTKRRLAVQTLVLLGILVALFVLIGLTAGTLTAVIEVGIFAVLLSVGFVRVWRRLPSP